MNEQIATRLVSNECIEFRQLLVTPTEQTMACRAVSGQTVSQLHRRQTRQTKCEFRGFSNKCDGLLASAHIDA